MQVTNAIFRNSTFFFLLLFASAFAGFWITYFARPAGTVHPYEHLHGIAMFGWILMLVVQSSLIRTSRRDIHRQIGKLAYVFGPLIIVSTFLLANLKLNMRGLTDDGVYLLSLQMFLLIQFVVPYTLAIKNRKRPDVHARYMVCTALPLIDPIFARVIFFNFIEAPFSSGVFEYITYSFTTLILVVLIILDWKSQQRRDVFLPMLPVVLATQIPSFFVIGSPIWMSFASWYMQLPLS